MFLPHNNNPYFKVKFGLYGGTFDPIHNAHLSIARYVKDKLGLNKIIFIPASIPPHKKTISASSIRFKMVETAIADEPAFECSDIEINRFGKSYSYDTICALKKEYQLEKEQIYWIMGADNLTDFNTWYKPDEILKICNVVIFPRKKHDDELTHNKFFQQILYLGKAPLIEISSSAIREKVNNGFSIKKIVPDQIEKIIIEEKLYR